MYLKDQIVLSRFIKTVFLLVLISNISYSEEFGDSLWVLSNSQEVEVIGIAESEDGIIYASFKNSTVRAVNANGSLLWQVVTPHPLISKPAITSSGEIVLKTSSSFIMLDENGNIVWQFLFEELSASEDNHNSGSSRFVIDHSDTIYTVARNTLFSLSFDGELLWQNSQFSEYYTDGNSLSSIIALNHRGLIYTKMIGRWDRGIGYFDQSDGSFLSHGAFIIPSYFDVVTDRESNDISVTQSENNDGKIASYNENGRNFVYLLSEGKVENILTINLAGSVFLKEAGSFFAVSSKGEALWTRETKCAEQVIQQSNGAVLSFCSSLSEDNVSQLKFNVLNGATGNLIDSGSVNLDSEFRGNVLLSSHGNIVIGTQKGSIISFFGGGFPLAASGAPVAGLNNQNTYFNDPNDSSFQDSDGDGIEDFGDNCPSISNNLQTDTDNDGFGNICDEDDDNDGLTDDEESIYNTDPLDEDTDNDGVSDFIEIAETFTDPLIKDTDGDGVNDGEELDAGTSPVDPASYVVGGTMWSAELPFSSCSTPAIMPDGNIVVAAGDRVFLLSRDGEIIWERDFSRNNSGQVCNSPSVSNDSTIYFPTSGGTLFALKSDGTDYWSYSTVRLSRTTPAIGADGTVYVGNEASKLLAIKANGEKRWEVSLSHRIDTPPVIGINGNIYVRSTSGIIYAINRDGKIIWQSFASSGSFGTLAINSDNSIFTVSSDQLLSIGVDGQRMWRTPLTAVGDITPIVGEQGYLYLSATDHLIKFKLDGSVASDQTLESAADGMLLLDTENRLYVYTDKGILSYSEENDQINWEWASSYEISGHLNMSNNGALIFHGTSNTHSKIFAIKTESNGLRNTSWPRFAGDSRNSGLINVKRTALDFDGDLKADIAIRRPSTGFQFISESSTGNKVELFFGNKSSDIPIHGDFDGDGITDIAVFRTETGGWFIKRSSDKAIVRLSFGTQNGDVPVPRDYDGDSITDIAIYRPNTGMWAIRYSSDISVYKRIILGGKDGDIPIPSDYDGDGKVDLAVRRPETGEWIIKYSESEKVQSVIYGLDSNDICLPGDYDGDGIDDFAIWRPDTGFWYVRNSTSGKINRTFFGIEDTDIPIQADYDGDGKIDIAFRRPRFGSFNYLSSKTGDIKSNGFGFSTDYAFAYPISVRMNLSDEAKLTENESDSFYQHTNDMKNWEAVIKEPISQEDMCSLVKC